MKLLIDIGNTQIKYAYAFNDAIQEVSTTLDNEVPAFLDEIKEGKIESVIVSSVVKESSLLNKIKSLDIPLIELSRDSQMGIKVEYQPNTVGLDRLVNLAGAMEVFPNHHCMVIDLGSAITIDVITMDGRFIGGNISPGMQLRFKALNENTANLPMIDVPDFTTALGKNTKNAISNGVIQGIVFEIEGYIKALDQRFQNMQKIITGGDARYFADQLKSTIFVEQKLTMIGLNRLSILNEYS